MGAETSADTETAAETDGGVVETDQSEAAAVDTEIIDEDELLEELHQFPIERRRRVPPQARAQVMTVRAQGARGGCHEV